MTPSEFLAEEIYRRYGSVKRARECFLYTAKGVRLTDLFLEDGRAILGWGGSQAGKSAFTQMKNVLSRGLTGSYTTDFTNRLNKAASVLLQENVKVYPRRQKNADPQATLWQPWTEKTNTLGPFILRPPLPWAEEIELLCIPEKTNTVINSDDCIHLPAALEAALTRSLYNLLEAIKKRQEKDWFIYDPVLTKYFTRKGPYLTAKVNEVDYRDFVLHCLDCGLVINPDYEGKSIVPYGADKGVFARLVKSPFKSSGNREES